MYEIYTIMENDTLDSIAKNFNTTKEELERLNGTLTNLNSGNSIIVPKAANEFFEVYTIKKGDNLYKIATELNISPDLLANLNGLNNKDYIYPNQQIVVPKENVTLYITAEGDTLGAVLNGMKADEKMFLNQNKNIYLYPGQLLLYKK